MLWPIACTGHHLRERCVVLIAALLNNLFCELYKLTSQSSQCANGTGQSHLTEKNSLQPNWPYTGRLSSLVGIRPLSSPLGTSLTGLTERMCSSVVKSVKLLVGSNHIIFFLGQNLTVQLCLPCFRNSSTERMEFRSKCFICVLLCQRDSSWYVLCWTEV